MMHYPFVAGCLLGFQLRHEAAGQLRERMPGKRQKFLGSISSFFLRERLFTYLVAHQDIHTYSGNS